ncbi:unnamed protein product [Bemisia tabaci]|uniref:Uncharacterized protein n=1 Tax=Bemisia tabaci TaxID=7038 RepID=A0AAI8Y5Y8_BEMTA|nr:unnamed protein product [Bemisia tabaci]
MNQKAEHLARINDLATALVIDPFIRIRTHKVYDRLPIWHVINKSSLQITIQDNLTVNAHIYHQGAGKKKGCVDWPAAVNIRITVMIL